MAEPLTDHVDRLLGQSSCRLSLEEIADFTFGGFIGRPDRKPLLVEVVQAGIHLRKSQGLPLAVPVPEEIGFFLIAWGTEWLAEDRIHQGEMGIGEVRRRIKKIERRHGVKDGLLPWRVGKGPAEWEDANREYDRIAGQILADALRRHGAADMADMFLGDTAEFDRRREIGRGNLARLAGREDVVELGDRLLKGSRR